MARRFVRTHAAELPADLVADATLLVSELVTNAVRHGRPAISLVVSLDPPLIGVSVHDDGCAFHPLPLSRPPASATGGRGLMLLDQLSSRWGIEPHDPPPGKVVWFRLDPVT